MVLIAALTAVVVISGLVYAVLGPEKKHKALRDGLICTNFHHPADPVCPNGHEGDRH